MDGATRLFGYIEPITLTAGAISAITLDASNVNEEDHWFLSLLHVPTVDTKDSGTEFLRASWASSLLARALISHVLFSNRYANVDLLTKRMVQTAYTVAFLFNFALFDGKRLAHTISAGVRRVGAKKFQFKELEPFDITTQTPQGKAIVFHFAIGGFMTFLRILYLLNRLEPILSFLSLIKWPERKKKRRGSVISPRKNSGLASPTRIQRSDTAEDGSYIDNELSLRGNSGWFSSIWSLLAKKVLG